MLKKIAAFCLATLLAAGPIITSTNNGAINYYGISASAASDYSYKDNYGVTYTFTVKDDQTATLTGFSNAKANLVLPSTVKANGVSYTVTALGDNFGKANNTIQTLTIPNSITTIGDKCFWSAYSLKTVNNGSGVTECGSYAFSGSQWCETAIDQNGYRTLGKVLISYETCDTTLDMSVSKFDNIEYIISGAFGMNDDLEYLILPKNINKVDGMLAPQNLEEVKFYDRSLNRYVDLYDVCMNDNRNSFQSEFISNSYDAFAQTKVGDRITLETVKKIFQECGIAYKGAPGNTGYTALEEYNVVRKIYAYICQNFPIYANIADSGSTSFQAELFHHRGLVCVGFAEMLAYFCKHAGIKCVEVRGEGHAWDVINVGGRWFNVDCCATWTLSRQTFLTPDRTVENEMGCHHKEAHFQQYVCNTQFGDINFDGMVNSTDASLILNAYTTMNKPNCQFSSLQLVLCDVNRDGKINSVDACRVLAYYAYASTYKDQNGNPSSDVPSIESYMHSIDGDTLMS